MAFDAILSLQALELCSTVGQLQQSYREYLRIEILSSLQSRVSLFQLLFFESDYLIVTPRIGVTIVFLGRRQKQLMIEQLEIILYFK